MGQEQSAETHEVTPEDLSKELALKFASKCYTQLELYCYQQVFKSLADSESGMRYWSEATLCRYLELPDAIQVGPIVNQLVSNLAAFPFMSQAPSILTVEALLRVVTLMTERYKKVLKRGHKDRLRLLFIALAVFDRRASDALIESPDQEIRAKAEQALAGIIQGFDIDQPAHDDPDDDDEDDLAMAALDSLDAIEAIGLGERTRVQNNSFIPSDNFLKLVELLLLLAPLRPQDNTALHFEALTDDFRVSEIRKIANAILASFGIEYHPGITYRAFKVVILNSLPHLFDPFSPLFEHFLFEKEFDLSKRRPSTTSTSSDRGASATPKPLLPKSGDILTEYTVRQLGLFIPPSTLFHRLYPLYSGGQHGFSMGSFENKVFTWQAPTLLLVTGSILPDEATDSRERTFADSLPPRRLPSSMPVGKRVTYGAYIPVTWKQTHKTSFGNASTLLFQLDPVHDVFRASDLARNYITYVTPGASNIHPGISFGTPLPAKGVNAADNVPLGPVSLYLDSSLEFGVFTHASAGGGSFHPSVSPARGPYRRRARSQSNSVTEQRRRRSGSIYGTQHFGANKGDWQDRFEIDGLEVWGFGGEKEAERQRRNQEFEEREARLRREGVLGKTGDEETDKEILRMAGLIGHGHEGGSMQ